MTTSGTLRNKFTKSVSLDIDKMWAKADRLIIKQLEGDGALYCTIRFHCIFRKGILLLALPKERHLALATLSLYQPQARKARCLVACVRLLIRYSLHTLFLPSRCFSFGGNGPIAELRANDAGFGFLLGNPASKVRRVILARKTGSEIVIDKIGLSLSARKSVSSEVEIMRSLPDELPGLLKIRQSGANDHWSFYACPLVDGKSPEKRHDDLVVSIIRRWFDFAQKKALIDTEQWSAICEFMEGIELEKGNRLLGEGKDVEVMMGIHHGDFTPWNVKITSERKIVVIDWEYGSCSAPAAWDWIHYLLQRASLVDQLSAADTLEVCRDWANTAQGKDFMAQAGWGGNVELCIGSYLVYSNALGRFGHEGLLAEWMQE